MKYVVVCLEELSASQVACFPLLVHLRRFVLNHSWEHSLAWECAHLQNGVPDLRIECWSTWHPNNQRRTTSRCAGGRPGTWIKRFVILLGWLGSLQEEEVGHFLPLSPSLRMASGALPSQRVCSLVQGLLFSFYQYQRCVKVLWRENTYSLRVQCPPALLCWVAWREELCLLYLWGRK